MKKTRELTQDEVALFLMLEQIADPNELFENLKNESWVLAVIEENFKSFKMNVDQKVMIAILSIGDGIVGVCLRYVQDILNWMKENRCTELKWDTFVNKVYPHGIPILDK